ncbi:hypothetical protein DL95DRAFT_390913 [Leptodontidium sp. 2 PMI_412]|nr:hypothetical protein DL95DRAFT_390913 [Leptodontidium sp. 2 PMI_412]
MMWLCACVLSPVTFQPASCSIGREVPQPCQASRDPQVCGSHGELHAGELCFMFRERQVKKCCFDKRALRDVTWREEPMQPRVHLIPQG